MEFKLINHGGGIGGFQNVQEVLRQEIADTDGTHGPFIIESFECLPAFRYQRLPICAGEGQGPMNEEQAYMLSNMGTMVSSITPTSSTAMPSTTTG